MVGGHHDMRNCIKGLQHRKAGNQRPGGTLYGKGLGILHSALEFIGSYWIGYNGKLKHTVLCFLTSNE